MPLEAILSSQRPLNPFKSALKLPEASRRHAELPEASESHLALTESL